MKASQDFIAIGEKLKLRIKSKKYVVGQAIQFPEKSILRSMPFTVNIRQRWS